jgi:hypothetical protein
MNGPPAAGLDLETAVTGDPEAEVLIASLTRLSPADRRHVAARTAAATVSGEAGRRSERSGVQPTARSRGSKSAI